MRKDNNLYLPNNPGLILFFLKPNYKSSINMMNYNIYNFNNINFKEIINYNKSLKNEFLENKKTKDKTKNNNNPERLLKQISFIPKINEELLHYICYDNKIIFVEGIRAWEKYGVTKNNYSYALFDEISKINIKDNFFSFQEKADKILLKILKSKIKKIGFNKNNIGSAYLCGLFFNKELDKMISVSVGNILYSILRETSRQKYEIIYISTEQYHDINIPYQLSAFNEDYNHLDIKYHNININDIIVIGNNKQMILSFIDNINSKDNDLYNIDIKSNNNDSYLAKYKIVKSQICKFNNDNLSITSTASSF